MTGISVAKAEEILRIWISKSIPACRVCERTPDIAWGKSVASGVFELHVRCHGSLERIAVDVAEAAGRSWSLADAVKRLIDVVEPRLANLFAADASPDVRELLKYNREPWTAQRRKD